MSDPVYGYYSSPERSKESAALHIPSIFIDYKNANNDSERNELLVKMIDCFLEHKLNLKEFKYLPIHIQDLIEKGMSLKEQFQDYKHYKDMNLLSAAENKYQRILESLAESKLPQDLINKLLNDPKLIVDDKIRALVNFKSNQSPFQK